MNSKLTIIVPTLKRYVKGINYLHNYFKNKDFNLIIVDNSKKNLGFAKGVNTGVGTMKKTERNPSTWLLILNDDIEFNNDNTLSDLVKEAENRKLDALSPILRNPDGKMNNNGYKLLPFGKVEWVYYTHPHELNEKNVDGFMAACLLVKTSVFDKLKGFDESFFTSLEDVDFFLRFKKADFKMGLSSIEVLHQHMATTGTMGNFIARQDLINWWRLFFKHRDVFKFDGKFVLERLKNLSGLIKKTVRQ